MANKKDQQQYIVKGIITNQDKNPVEGLLVYAFDQDPNTPDNPLGQPAITDAAGKYTISFTEADFKIPKESGGPDVFIRVYAGAELLGKSPVCPKNLDRISNNFKSQTDLN